MSFKVFVDLTKELIDLVHQIPKDYPRVVEQYTSLDFSFKHNKEHNSTTYKKTTLYTVTAPPTVPQTSMSTPGTITINAPLHNYYHTQETCYRYQSSITIMDGELLDVKFIQKHASVANSISMVISDKAHEDGGTLIAAVLYLGDSKMLYNGMLYDMDNPEAFLHDLNTDTDVSILELHNLKEYYANS